MNKEELIVILKEIEEIAVFSKVLDKYETMESSNESHVSCSLAFQLSSSVIIRCFFFFPKI